MRKTKQLTTKDVRGMTVGIVMIANGICYVSALVNPLTFELHYEGFLTFYNPFNCIPSHVMVSRCIRRCKRTNLEIRAIKLPLRADQGLCHHVLKQYYVNFV